ncbi:MAG: hypothetical protein AB7L71_07610 [Vicinamibacterales bacterium]
MIAIATLSLSGGIVKGDSTIGTFLGPNDELQPNQSIQSDDGSQVLVYQGDGNLVVYQNGTAIWASNTYQWNPGRAIMQSDGNLVIYDSWGYPKWDSGTYTYQDATLHFLPQALGSGIVICQNGNSAWGSNAYGGTFCSNGTGAPSGEEPVEIVTNSTGQATCSMTIGSTVSSTRCQECGCSIQYSQLPSGITAPTTCAC